MPTIIDIDDNYAVEESTVKITVSFEDESGEEATPTSINWTLTDVNRTIINSRDAVSIVAPASTVTVVLSGDDLALQVGETGDAVYRYFTVEAVYSSDIGADLPLKDQLEFPLKNLVAVPNP